MFICCKTKKPKSQMLASPPQQPTKTPKYQIRTSNDQDMHSTNLTNGEATNDKINLSQHEVERFITDHRNKSKEQERDLVMRLIEQPEKTHLIEFNWAVSYTNYIKEDNLPVPSTIDNQHLLERIKNNEQLIVDRDYVLINEQVWNVLVSIYKGGPPLTIADLGRKSDNILDQSLKVFASPSMHDLSVYRYLNQMPSKEIQIVGLENDIFFCYLNSVLQCLMGITQLNHFFLSSMDNKSFTNAYSLLLKRAAKSHYKSRIVAKELIKVLQNQFSIYEMHDSSELFLFLVDKFKEEMLIKPITQIEHQDCYIENHKCFWQNNSTFIDELFHGQLTSFIKCTNCNKSSTQHDPFYDLSLPLVEKNFIQRKLTVSECLNKYFQEELIDSSWTCSHCNTKSKNFKRRLKITFAPNILVLQLKRFSSMKKKIKEPVLTDMELNIKDVCAKEISGTKYALQSMIVHSGSIDQGHYVAVVKRNQHFYLFNDDEIERLPLEHITRINSAYLLMYQRI